MSNKIHLLLAEDDANLGTLLSEYLKAKGFEVSLAKNGDEALTLFTKKNFDLCLLDVMMPIKDGITLTKDIRKVNDKIPIIFLTAKSQNQDKIEGFKSGADDYITKPFSMEELLLRVEAVLKRSIGFKNEKEEITHFKIGNYDFDYPTQTLKSKNGEQKLTSKENELLRLLCITQNDVLDRSYALKVVWGDDNYFNSRSMDVYITKLRKHFKEDDSIEIINVHGKGFRLLVK